MTTLRYISLSNPYEYTQLLNFLSAHHLTYDKEAIDCCLGIYDDTDELLATASLSGYVIRNVAVSPHCQGEGLVNTLLSELLAFGASRGIFYFQLFTKPQYIYAFTDIGFRLLAKTEYAALLEFGSLTPQQWGQRQMQTYSIDPNRAHAAVVMNANPFTCGHQYLLEEVCQKESSVLLFIVEENRSALPFSIRLDLVKRGTAHLSNLTICPSGPYIISQGTFPSYFLKKEEALFAQTSLDAEIFGSQIAPLFHIQKRYVGTEPTDKVTAVYNHSLRSILSSHQISLYELKRKELNGTAISASVVRQLWLEQNWQAIVPLVPAATLEFLQSSQGEALRQYLIKDR